MPVQQSLVLYLVVPLWLLAGFVDWLCHRRTHIETTSGGAESALHLLMLAETGVPLIAALYLQTNALVLGVLLVGLLAHEVTAYIDIRYAASRRHISPTEQLVHSVLEMAPLIILLLLASSSWEQWRALFGRGSEPARLDVIGSLHAPTIGYSIGLAVSVLALAVIPYAEEWLRARAAEGCAPVNGAQSKHPIRRA
jgi:hypothetical protein